MTRYDRRHWLLAVGMSAVAGYVDATGFLKLGGLFVSFMSGNSTRLGVGFVRDPDVASITVLLILAFVTGTLLATIAGPYRKHALLAFVGTMLTLAAALDATLPVTAVAMLMTFAMGAANTVFQRDGEVSIGVTYMTGTLVKFGQRLAAALMDGPRWHDKVPIGPAPAPPRLCPGRDCALARHRSPQGAVGNDLLSCLDRLERGLATLRRRTLIVGLAAIAVVAPISS